MSKGSPAPWFRKSRNSWFVTLDGRQINLETDDRKEAYRRWHGLALQAPASPVAATRLTVRELLAQFLEWAELHTRSYNYYSHFLKPFAGTIPHDLQAADLRPFHVTRWLDRHCQWKPNTHRCAIAAVKRAYNWGVAEGYLDFTPLVARLEARAELPVRRLEVGPGEEAQIDFGSGAPVRMPDGRQRRPWVFRVVLSYSRKAYSEVVWRQTTEAFLGALENAFHHFGGAPERLVIDNLKAAVQRGDWYDPEVHPKLQSFAAHFGAAFLPTKPYTPRHKGKIERGIGYVKNNALKARIFESLAAQNEFLAEWEAGVADTRIHGTTQRQVSALFELERSALLPLPRERFPYFHEARRAVHQDGHLEVDKAYYSAPPEYVGRRLWVRWDSRLVRIFNDRWEQLAVHAKAEPGRFRTACEHIPEEKVSAVERGTVALLRQIAALGPFVRQWSQAMTQARGVEGVRVLVGLSRQMIYAGGCQRFPLR